MRPLKLTLQAFGAFAKRIEIPFNELGVSNVYLISGDTGSGKTTIFDAICYALFNTSSTSLRGNETFKSHFADDKIESFVEFEFNFLSNDYKIIRYPSFARKKTKGDGFKIEPSRAALYLPDGKILTKVKDVDKYIIDLLGVDSKQFSQIALLAQGEFLKLLNSDTQARGEIFRNIFKTSNYSFFQEKLKNLMFESKKEYDFLEKTILQSISQIEACQDDFLKLKNEYVNNSAFFEFERFISLFSAQNKEIQTKIDVFADTILDKNKILLKLQSQIQTCQTKTNLLNQLSVLKKEQSKHLSLFEIAKVNFKNLPNLEKKLQELIVKYNELEKDYKTCLDILEFEKQVVLNQTKIEKNILDIDKNKETLKQCQIMHLENLNFNLDNLNADLKNNQDELISLQKTFDIKNNEYNILSKQYLNSQAGIIALNLVDNEPCPVCGSLVHPDIAKMDDNIVSQEQLEKLKEENDKLSKTLHEISSECSLLLLKIENAKKEFLAFTKKYCLENVQSKKHSIDFELEFEKISKEKESLENIKRDLDNLQTSLKTKIDTLKSKIKISNIDECLKLYKQTQGNKTELEKEINKIKSDYEIKNLQNNQYISNIELLEKQLNELKDIDVSNYENLCNEIKILTLKLDELTQEKEKLISLNASNLKIFSKISELYSSFVFCEKKFIQFKRLSECANGNLKGKAKIAFEQYIQAYYLDMVLFEANKRLKIMTQNRFQLMRKKEVDSMQSKTGLDLEVMDFYTYKSRSTKTLSGGESFKAALALALGLSDCISNLSGAININSMFIDEGFGSLDSESLELALDVIGNLSSTNRLIGIISHVDALKLKIQNQIQVNKSANGSDIKIIF